MLRHKNMFRLADLDDNGYIDFREFVRMLSVEEEERY